MNKLRPLQADREGGANIQAKYEEIYRDSDVWLYKRSHGIHSIVCTLLRDQLRGRRMLDVGCGAGRLALMAAELGAAATGFDFSVGAITLARLNAECTGHPASFEVADIDTFCGAAQEPFDVVTLIGVLEHVEDPTATLRAIQRVMKPGGILVVSCPAFINPRGFSYMPLLTLLRLPMSLADLRQVDFMDVARWCEGTGLVLERTVGALYRSAWDARGAADMIKRVPLAFKDAQLPIAPDFERFNAWQLRMATPGRMVLDWLESQSLLLRVEPAVHFTLRRPDNVDELLWARINDYLHENVADDPFYGEQPPFCYLGGEGIYLMRLTPPDR